MKCSLSALSDLPYLSRRYGTCTHNGIATHAAHVSHRETEGYIEDFLGSRLYTVGYYCPNHVKTAKELFKDDMTPFFVREL